MIPISVMIHFFFSEGRKEGRKGRKKETVRIRCDVGEIIIGTGRLRTSRE